MFQKRRPLVETIASAVYSMGSVSRASRYLSAAGSERGVKCLQDAEAHKLAALKLRGQVEVAPLGGLASVPGVSGVRVRKCLQGTESCASQGSSFADRLWFTRGRYAVALIFIAGARNEATSGAPVALPVERHLVALLHRRAKEQLGGVPTPPRG